MSVIDLVKWDNNTTDIVWKHPSQQLSTWTQLIVHETQEVVLVKSGQFIGLLSAGKHTLDTKNIPLLTQIIGIPFGGKSPFTAEVWFVNKATNLGIKWGTPDPIQIEDPKYKTILPIRAYGQYGILIKDSFKFLKTIIGTLSSASSNDIRDQLKGILLANVKSALAKSITTSETSIFDINTKLDLLSKSTQEIINKDIYEYGFEITSFFIASVSVPEDDAAVVSLKNALAKKAEMGILGYTYQQEKSFEVLNSAANNEGSSGTVMGAGLGLGMGAGIGAPIAQALADVTPNMSQQISNPENKIKILKELAKLRDEGILSENEFLEEKRKILGG